MKDKETELEKIFLNDTSDMDLISKYYEELLQDNHE